MYKFDEKKHVHTFKGKRLHGVTTVLKMWGDPNPLLNWGVKTACDFIANGGDIDEARSAHLKVRDKAGDKGTEVHAELEMMMNESINQSAMTEYSPITEKVYTWLQSENITPLASEMNVWSEEWWVGGIIDGVVEKEGKKYILDFKTSGSVQTKYFYQLGAYAKMYEDSQNEKIHGAIIVHIPRGKSFNPEKNVYYRYDVDALKQAFENILNVYKLDQELQKLTNTWSSTKSSVKI